MAQTERTRSDEELRLRAAAKTLADSIDGSYRRDGAILMGDWELMCEVQRFVRDQFVRMEQADKLSPHTAAAAKMTSRLGFLMHEWSRSRQYIDMQRRDLDAVRADLRAEIERQKAEQSR